MRRRKLLDHGRPDLDAMKRKIPLVPAGRGRIAMTRRMALVLVGRERTAMTTRMRTTVPADPRRKGIRTRLAAFRSP
jgi:hypothetical protein